MSWSTDGWWPKATIPGRQRSLRVGDERRFSSHTDQKIVDQPKCNFTLFVASRVNSRHPC